MPALTLGRGESDHSLSCGSGTFNSQIASVSSFEYWDSTGARHTGSGAANLVAANVASGIGIFGVTGSATLESHSSCASDGAIGCITTASYVAVDAANLTAGNVRAGVTLGGVMGQYPSASYKLPGDLGVAFLAPVLIYNTRQTPDPSP